MVVQEAKKCPGVAVLLVAGDSNLEFFLPQRRRHLDSCCVDAVACSHVVQGFKVQEPCLLPSASLAPPAGPARAQAAPGLRVAGPPVVGVPKISG